MATRAGAQHTAEEETIATTNVVLAKRRRELLVARVALGLGTADALVLALAAD